MWIINRVINEFDATGHVRIALVSTIKVVISLSSKTKKKKGHSDNNTVQKTQQYWEHYMYLLASKESDKQDTQSQLSKIFQRKIAIIFLSIILNMCFGCPQHMFWLRNKKNNFSLRTLIWGPEDTRPRSYIQNMGQHTMRFLMY